MDAHWINSWFVRAFARPILTVDGTEHALPWRQATRVVVDPGEHHVAVGVCYRGFGAVLGQEPVKVHVADRAIVHLTAKNGPLNSDPFRIAAVGTGTQLGFVK